MKRHINKIIGLSKYLYFVGLAIIITIIFNSCATKPKYLIGISKAQGSESYQKYNDWLKSYDSEIETVDLYFLPLDSSIKILSKCSGLLLSGGPDVNPVYYNQIQDSNKCEIDNYRDTLEFTLIKKAQEMNLPILGICRGLQILNIAYGGSLIVDIPTDFDSSVTHKCSNKDKCFHNINILKNTDLYVLANRDSGIVNSNHHQAINVLANDFRASSISDNRIIESIEWKEKKGKPFMFAVQWHPERLDTSIAFSKKIAELFINNIKIYGNKTNKIKK